MSEHEAVSRGPKLPPGPKGSFLVGNTFQYMRDRMGFLEGAKRDFGDIVRLRLGPFRTYLVTNPEYIEYILRSHPDNFHKDKLTRWLIPLLGEGLLTSEDAYWRRQRKLAQPSFQHQQIERYGAVMVEHTERMLDAWQEGEVRDLHEDLMRLTLSIVARTLFDAELSGDAEAIGESLAIVMNHFLGPSRWFPFADHLPFPASRRYWAAIRRIDEIIYRIIRTRREVGRDAGDLVSRLLAARDDEGKGMTDRQLRDEVVTLVLAGHETTALALFYIFYLMDRWTQAQDRLAAELQSVLGDRSPTAADVPRLKYTEWVVREAMRLYPPAWGIAREALTDCEIGGYHVPKGTQLFVTQWLVHRDGRWFEDPEVFRPERWDNDLIKRLPRCAYFPFGDGPRVCIGNHFAMMEAVLILATIARRYRVSVEPGQTLELLPSITLRPRHGLRMRVHQRETGPASFASTGDGLTGRNDVKDPWAIAERS
jgi:cytochrome P450